MGALAPFFARKRGKTVPIKGDNMPINWDAWDACNRTQTDAADANAFKMPDFSGMDRSRQAKWDRLHMRTVSTKLRKEEYEELMDYCIRRGTKPYTLLRRIMRGLIYRPPATPSCDEGPRTQ